MSEMLPDNIATHLNLQVLHRLHDVGRPQTAEEIRAALHGRHQTISARCTDLELMGLLKIGSRERYLTNARLTTVKTYALTDAARWLLIQPDCETLHRTAVRMLNAMYKRRAIDMAQLKQDWRYAIAGAMREHTEKIISSR